MCMLEITGGPSMRHCTSMCEPLAANWQRLACIYLLLRNWTAYTLLCGVSSYHEFMRHQNIGVVQYPVMTLF